jgi:hypothetical protein
MAIQMPNQVPLYQGAGLTGVGVDVGVRVGVNVGTGVVVDVVVLVGDVI